VSTSLRLEAGVNEPKDQHRNAFSALTLLVRRQEEHQASRVMRCWRGYLPGLERGANDLHILLMLLSCIFKILLTSGQRILTKGRIAGGGKN